MEFVRRSVIDIGTNSVKLLVADCAEGIVRPVYQRTEVTRLGEGAYSTGMLSAEAVERTALAVAGLAEEALAYGLLPAAFATSAARHANNSTDLIQAVARYSSLPVQIITGNQEADWAFKGINTDPHLKNLPLVTFDLGGGSTEFVIGQCDNVLARHSFPVGTLRSLDQMQLSDPPTSRQLAECRHSMDGWVSHKVLPAVSPAIQKLSSRGLTLAGTGENLLILGQLIQRLSGNHSGAPVLKLRLEDLTVGVEWLWSKTVSERLENAEISALRADVVLPASVIVESITRGLGFTSLSITGCGLRHGFLMSGARMFPAAAAAPAQVQLDAMPVSQVPKQEEVG